MRIRLLVIVSMLLLLVVPPPARAAGSDLPALKSLPPTTDQSALGRRGYLYVGGVYTGKGKSRVMRGQAYVEVLVPKRPRRPYPIVMIHGGGLTSTYWLQTPDGRPGWADYFVRAGYVVYLVDEPARGRSPYHAATDGPVFIAPPSSAARSLIAPERYGGYPQAKYHTQWPDRSATSGSEGNPTFDATIAGQFPSLKSQIETELLSKHAVDLLLDRIGPAILLTHSQGGPVGWVIADGRPGLVRAIVAIEPSGPPFKNLGNGTTPANKGRVYGVTDSPMTYDPPITSAAQLVAVDEAKPDGPDLITCTLQASPARQLVNLEHVPVLQISSQASYHSPYDHCTAKYLKQAGVPVDFTRLADVGIKGNDHMMMIERNNQQIAALIDSWLRKKIEAK